MIKPAKVSNEPNPVSPWFSESSMQGCVCVCRGGGGVFEYVGLWTFMRDRKGERESESEREVGISDLLFSLSIQGLKDE